MTAKMCISARNCGFLCLLCMFCVYAVPTEKIYYFKVEHATVRYFNPSVFETVQLSSRRYNRQDPVYYVKMTLHFKYAAGNNISISFFFYEFLSNEYKRSFVEIVNQRMCKLIDREPVFGVTVKRALERSYPGLKCPYPGGLYVIDNCTMNAAPLANFPFKKGRIYVNATVTGTTISIVQGQVDFEINEMRVKKRNKH